MDKKSSLALIVPCYNEAKSIPVFETELIEFNKSFNEEFAKHTVTIIVVNNNSTDNSYELLKDIEGRIDNLKVIECGLSGYGAALKKGFAIASAEYLSFIDLDNTYPMSSLIDLFKRVISDDLDIVFGARIHKTSEISIIRYLGNQIYVVLLKYLFNSPLTDVCSGMRIFKADRKEEILSLKAIDLSFSIEFTSHVLVNKWKVSEIPIPYRERIGESKLSVIKDGVLFLLVVIRKYLSDNRKCLR